MVWGPVLIGAIVELLVVAVGALVPVSREGAIRIFFALGLLNVGVLGGAVTGVLLGGSWRSNAVHGLATGALGGAVFGIILFGTVTNVLPSVRYTGFWTIHYFIATEVPTPSWMVVRYGRFVVAGISLLVAMVVTVESGIAAVAVPSANVGPSIEE